MENEENQDCGTCGEPREDCKGHRYPARYLVKYGPETLNYQDDPDSALALAKDAHPNAYVVDQRTGTRIDPEPAHTYGYDRYDRDGVTRQTVTLGENDVIGVMLDESDNVVDWIESDTYWETAENMATWGERFVYLAKYAETDNIRIVLSERDRAADCFGTPYTSQAV